MANKQGYTVLERYPVISYALIDRGEKSYQRFVAAWLLDESNPDKLTWAQGHYFTTLFEANRYIRSVLCEGINPDDIADAFEDDDWSDLFKYIDEDCGCDLTGYCTGRGCPQWHDCPDAC